jgi:molybdopterin-guanine dinucleotide biosynthesis protein A
VLDDVFAAILVGGRGQRLGGTDKAMLCLPEGEPLLARLVDLLTPAVREVVLVGRHDQTYPSVSCRLLSDTIAAAGPLAGLDAALTAGVAPWCFLVACDMPRLGCELLYYLADRRTSDACVVVPAGPSGIEPTAALYACRCRDEVRKALDQGERALHRMVAGLRHNAVEVPALLAAQLTNVNTRDDLLSVGID